MKIPLTLLAAAGFAGVAFAQTPLTPVLPAPVPELSAITVWNGEWSYTGKYLATPLGPETAFTGKMSGRAILNGNVAEFTYHEKTAAGESELIELCWYDKAARYFAYVMLGNDGYSEQGPFKMEDNVCTWEGRGVAGGTAFRIRGRETVAPDKQTLTRTAEIAVDGTTWLPFMRAVYTRVAGPPGCRAK